MAVVEVRTFKDIQDAILRRGKIEDTTENRTAIKEYANTLYQQICREDPYRWSGATAPIKLRGKYNTGTVTATNDSDILTGDSTVWVENDHRFSKIQLIGSGTGSTAVPKIIRVASNTSLTMDQPFLGTTASEKSYEIYRDEYGLFPDFQDIRRLRIPSLNVRRQPRPIGPEKMDILRDRSPFREGNPQFYTIFGKSHYTEKTWATFNIGTDYWEESLDNEPQNQTLIVWPGIMNADRIALIRYTRTPYPMNADDDEPWIPYEDRSVLVWGVLKERFMVNRDMVTKREWEKEYKFAKKKMASDIEKTDDELKLIHDRNRYRRTRWWEEDEDEIASLYR